MDDPRTATIIVSSYNYGRFVGEAIESALAQTHPHVEVIVVDDGSTDNSREVIATFGTRVTGIFKDNGGQASAFNRGMARSRGEMVIFLDSDDVLLPTAVVEALTECGPGVSKVHWPMLVIDSEGRRTGRVLAPAPPSGDLREHVIQCGPFDYGWPPTSANAWARDYLARIFPMPEAVYATNPDLYLSTLAPFYGRIGAIGHPLTLWRDHGGNSSFSGDFEARVSRCVQYERHSLGALADHLERSGRAADVQAWVRRSWWHRIAGGIRDIVAVVPDGTSFILVDEDSWDASDVLRGRRRVPFVERDGRYWGPPADDGSAIDELARLRDGGAAFVFFAWQAFWWLEHYQGFREHLEHSFRKVVENERLVGFDLGKTPDADGDDRG